MSHQEGGLADSVATASFMQSAVKALYIEGASQSTIFLYVLL